MEDGCLFLLNQQNNAAGYSPAGVREGPHPREGGGGPGTSRTHFSSKIKCN